MSPLTPILSIIKPFSLGREGSMSGRGGVTTGVGGTMVGIGVEDGKVPGCESAETVEAIVVASVPETCGNMR